MAETDFGDSIKQIVEEIAQGIHDKDQRAAADSESAADHTPVRRKARIAPRVERVAARFDTEGGSLDRRSGLTDRWIEDSPWRSGWNSPAGHLALPASTTWSNGTVEEAVARKGNRNNRPVAESVVGRVNEEDDRAAEKKLGRGRGYYMSKSWASYGRKLGKHVCGACYGACCSATRDFVSRLVEDDFLPPETQSANVCSLGYSFNVNVVVVSGLQQRDKEVNLEV